MREITATTTYEPVDRDKTEVISEHLRYMTVNRIIIKPELRCLPSFYWLPKLHKQPYGNNNSMCRLHVYKQQRIASGNFLK